jgi:DNA-binding MarR family transcriptional regulator
MAELADEPEDSVRPGLPDGLTPHAAFDYSVAYTTSAVELVPELDSEPMLLFVLLARLARLSSYDFENSVHRTEGLTYSSFYVVALLAVIGPMENSRLAAASGMSRASVSAMVKTLIRDGWIEATPSPNDRRSVVLALTKTGSSRIPDLFLRLNQREKAWAGALTPGEREQFTALLKRVLDGAPDDAPQRR